MIVYGLTMQGKAEEIPKEVATWVFDRESKYPNIEFVIDYWNPHASQINEFKSMVRKYSRLYSFWSKFVSTRVSGVNVVVFPYLSEQWCVKIVGGINQKGEIADLSVDEIRHSLPAALRAEIAELPIVPELPSEIEKINENLLGFIRGKGNLPLERPSEMIPFSPDWRWTSEFSLSGDELEKFAESAKLLLDPAIQKEAESAIRAKDWEKLKQLKAQRYN